MMRRSGVHQGGWSIAIRQTHETVLERAGDGWGSRNASYAADATGGLEKASARERNLTASSASCDPVFRDEYAQAFVRGEVSHFPVQDGLCRCA